MIETCPGCQADLVVRRTVFRTTTRTIGVEVNAFDGVLLWQCPDCAHLWHRWPVGDWRWQLAEPYVNAGGMRQ